ncbi:integrase catalytic domain-containing protein [Paludibacterium denitrificans]|uniref:DDE-type integrase/transposase/recombinase n=1 Tax=Paludibacterium denitrificans TaxID=2675226 RepID=A0A844GDR0_9NEIS|nr:DDE-type integrase/transposase/recombinase [Paludibacterium denitrificans]MTD33057.1 DDE-type integrase/transposase/recombinase [Paludibacterium denitrificans]
MSGFALRKSMTFEWDGTAFRIDRLPSDGSALIERLSDGQFSTVSRHQLLQAFGAGKIRTLSQEKNQPTVPDRIFMEPLASIPEHLQKEARRRHQYLQAIADAGVAPSSKIELRDVVTECAEQIGDLKPPSRATIFRWYRKFIQQNDTRALIPKYHRRGNRQLRQPKLILDMAGQAIEEAFKLSPRASIRQIYHRLVGKIELHNRKLLPIEHLKVPSERTVHRMVQQLEAFQLVAYRDGKLAASKKFRRVLNSVETSRILERVEVDHTPLDLFLIDEVSGLPLGRPTLTVMIDHFSRMLLGYYLSYGNPSTAAVMGALRHAVLPKELSHAAIPGLTIENQWECYGRPDVMVLDNGMEFHSNDLESVAFDLDIRLQYCPKHEPRFKGVVERYLKTINYFFAQQLPGTSMARLHLRGDYDPIKHAVLTFAEFNHLFQKWVVDVYAATPHRGLHGRCPRDVWKDGLQHREPELPESLQALQCRIGQVQERRLRPDGIQLNGIRYNGDSLTRILQSYGPG